MESVSTSTRGSSNQAHLHDCFGSVASMTSTNAVYNNQANQPMDICEGTRNGCNMDPRISERLRVKVVERHSSFTEHPYDLGLLHYAPPELNTILVFEQYEKGLVNLDSEHIVSLEPSRVAISGHSLCKQMMVGQPFGVELCDVIMRLYKRIDDSMCKPGQDPPHTRWRHFLPASFTVKVLNGENFLEDDDVRSAFIGDQISYNVADCSMITAPVFLEGSWSCYFWDFEQKKMHILDPTLMRRRAALVQQRHSMSAKKLLKAMSRCKSNFFKGWDADMKGWTVCFQVGLGVSCHKNNSGLLATHYSRAYSGERVLWDLSTGLLWDLKTDEHRRNRAELLYRLLAIGNRGEIPESLIYYFDI